MDCSSASPASFAPLTPSTTPSTPETPSSPIPIAKAERRKCEYEQNLHLIVLPLQRRTPSKKANAIHKCTHPGCEKVFTRPFNLKSHMRTHTKERPFKCDKCDAAFSRLHDRNRHEKTHWKVKPYSCIVCQRPFVRRDALTRHLKVDNGRNPCNVAMNMAGMQHLNHQHQHHNNDNPHKQHQPHPVVVSPPDSSSPSLSDRDCRMTPSDDDTGSEGRSWYGEEESEDNCSWEPEIDERLEEDEEEEEEEEGPIRDRSCLSIAAICV